MKIINLKALCIALACVGSTITLAYAQATQTPSSISQKAPSAANTSASEAPQYELSWHSLHMGTLISAKVFGTSKAQTQKFYQLVEDEVVKYDDMMSVFKKTPLNDVNARAGQAVAVPKDIADMTRESIAIAKETDSAFEPTIGPLVNLWKIGFGGHDVPSDADIQKTLRHIDHNTVRVFEKNNTWYVQINKGQNIDMGGIAKGFIGQKITEALHRAGAQHAFVDLGGNIALLGEKAPGVPWKVGLQSPKGERGQYFAVVSARDTNVITSGAYERYFKKNGELYGHILSAKTGYPVKTDLSSVTIVDKNGARADALCTALFAMGAGNTEKFLAAHPNIHAIILKDDLKTLLVSQPLLKDLKVVDPKIKIVVIGKAS